MLGHSHTAKSNTQHILIVDDEEDVRLTIRDALGDREFAFDEAASGTSALDIVRSRHVDLILLDLRLGNTDVDELFHEIRTQHHIPVIVVTVCSDSHDEVAWLTKFGVEDYIRKPFHGRALLERVRKVLRRGRNPTQATSGSAEGHASDVVTAGGLVLNDTQWQVRTATGRLIELTYLEYKLLRLFMTTPKRVLSRYDIMDKLKGQDYEAHDRAIDVLVSKLRRKIEQPGESSIIKTIRGAGYSFGADS